jgi:hypothetical protein
MGGTTLWHGSILLNGGLSLSTKDDVEIYEDIQVQLQSRGGGGAMGQAKMAWKQIKQLRAQKDELVRQTGSILNRLDRLGKVRDMVSIGDHGKMVIPFRETLGIGGYVWIVNDTESDEIPAVLERGSLQPVGTFVQANLYVILFDLMLFGSF